MSLRVWLPLTGHLDNQGLDDITVTNNGATIDNNGKIGKCYSFGTSTSYLTLSNDAINKCTTECSLSMWLNIIAWNTSYATYFQAGLGSTPWAHYIFGVLRNGSGSNLCFTISNGSTASNASYITPTLTLDTWYHLAFVYKTGHCLIYINGELYKDYATTIVPNFSGITKTTVGACNNGSNYQTNCKLNDVRVYDHALSPKEIKEISKGLVCHYTLGDIGGCPNLYTGSHDFLGTWGNSASWTTDTETFNGFVVKKRTGTWAGLYQNIPATINDIFTISFYAKRESGANVMSIHRSSLGNVTTGLSILGGNFETGTTWLAASSSNLDWKYCWATVKITSADITYLQWRIENSVASKTMWITHLKIERGDKATPWIPNSADPEYTIMGYDESTVYDSSGLNNHMTAYGSPTSSANTVRNSVSTHFTNGQYALAQSNSNVYLPKDVITVNIWMNCSTWGNPISCTEGGGWNFENASAGVQFPCYISGVGYKVANSGIAASTLLNAWHMLTGVFDGTSVKIYIDAELKATTATGSTNGIGYAANRLVISGEAGSATPASSTFVGEISDVRIYATPLSEEDIQALYNTPVSISNTGAVVTQGEFVEV